jgi:glycosyltransferase involved in cell wall biosynthesis
MSTYSRILMLGAAAETRSSITSVVQAYRAGGLFSRWPIEYLPTHGEGGLLANAQLYVKAVRDFGFELGRHKGAVVHIHTAPGAHFWRDAPFMAAAMAVRSPCILHLHGAGFETMGTGGLLRTFLENAACVAVPSESMRTWVRSVSRNANAVCVPHPVVEQQKPGENKPNLILFLGRMDASKGIFDLLQAVAALRPAVPDVRLACAGDGDRLSVARFAERLGIADAVKFTGWVGPSGKRALLESAAVFALPSYQESLPVSLLEAMSAGVPAVVSPVGGIPEVVVDGVSGFFAAPGDIASLERHLRRLLLDRKLGARIGAAARESASLRFSPERALPVLEEIYRAAGVTGGAGQPSQRAPHVRDLRKAA